MMTEPPANAGAALGADNGADQGADDKSIHIPADALPPGIKQGDTLKCVAADEGGFTFELTSSTAQDDSASWEADLKHEMSPQTPQEGAQ